jgi:hypothetical protein
MPPGYHPILKNMEILRVAVDFTKDTVCLFHMDK